MAATITPPLTISPPPSGHLSHRRQPPDHHHLLSLLDNPSSLTPSQLHQIHARMLRLNLLHHPFPASRLLTAFTLPPSPNLPHALQLFDQIPQPNLYSFNLLIRSLSSSLPLLSLQLFSRLLNSPLPPDRFTFPFALKSAASLPAFPLGAAAHAMVIKSHFHSDIFILNSLIHFYSVSNHLDSARIVFDHIPERDLVSWNSMITALARADRFDSALELFYEMNSNGLRGNDVTMIGVLSACGKKGDLELGRSMHCYIKVNRIPECLILDNAVLHMYAKCGSSGDARTLFDSMKEKDSISWATMVFAHARAFEFDAARKVFDEMPEPDIAAWNALISGYEQNGRPREALAVFHELRNDADIEPDRITLVAALSACSQLSAIESGKSIHVYLKTTSFDMNRHLATALIDMYSKCGDLENAIGVFQSVENRDVFVWSSMIAGLGMYGRGNEALDLFREMRETKVEPNHVTFTNILCACSHAGLIEEGKSYFNQMQSLYKIAPGIEHYGCMVDILGRAGRFEEALQLINSMPEAPPASVWGALLGACAVQGNVELGELAGNKLLLLEPRNDGAYVLLSNLFAKAGRWEDVGLLRKRMKDQGLKKEAGRSSMEVDGKVHEFLAGDASHFLSERIYQKLGEMMARLKNAGYEPKKTQVLQNVEDEDSKELALNLHSEKLAIAFGLIRMSGASPIRIQKNLRICEDCHAVAKLVSDVYEREILIRDRYRFHHFEGGRCSCGDYW